MKLKTKLFCSIGSLFLLMALASFFLPRFFIKSDVLRIHSFFTDQIKEQNSKERQLRQRLLDERLERGITYIHSSLLNVIRTTPPSEKENVWQMLEEIVENNPVIGFAQISKGQESFHSIVVDNAIIYKTTSHFLTDTIALVVLTADVDGEKKIVGPLVGFSTKKEDGQLLLSLYASKNDLSSLLPVILDGALPTTKQSALLAALKSRAQKIERPKTVVSDQFEAQVDIDYSLPEEMTRRNNLIRKYIQEALRASNNDPLGKEAFLGISSLSGFALLSQDIFFDQKLFDALDYFKTHLPPPKSSGPTTGVALIDSPLLDQYFIGGVISLENPPNSASLLLTLGQNLFGDLSLTTLINEELIVILDPHGELLQTLAFLKNKKPPDAFETFPFSSIINADLGDVKIGDETYSFFHLTPTIPLPVTIYALLPNSSEPLVQLQEKVDLSLSKINQTLSDQLFASALVLFGIALIMLGLISRHITRPISSLAKATEEVAKGKYEEIVLPPVKKSGDEVAALGNSFAKMIQGLKDKEKIRGMLDKVVSKEIAAEILKGDVQLGGELKEVTMLFADIRNFTKGTEHMDPKTLISQLNIYLTGMTEIIEKEGGVIDKYVGDEIMALFGAPLPMPDGAARAIKVALSMLEKLREWNAGRKAKGLAEIPIGIGIHTGEVVAGNVGATTRLNYTVLGANVNLASRLCAVAEGMQIRVSIETLEKSGLKDRLFYDELPPVELKGFTELIRSYSIKSLNN